MNLGELRRTMFVMEMNKHKTRVTDHTKLRQKEEFEDAVIALGWAILNERNSS